MTTNMQDELRANELEDADRHSWTAYMAASYENEEAAWLTYLAARDAWQDFCDNGWTENCTV